MKNRIWFLTALVLVASIQAFAYSGAPLWANLNDIIHFTPKAMPDATIIMNAVHANDARFTDGGAQLKGSFHLEQAPSVLPNKNTLYRGAMLMLSPQHELMFRKFDVEVGGEPRSVQRVSSPEQDILVSQMHFSIAAGLIDRMLVLESAESHIRIIYPLGVGGYDDNVMGHGKRLLTPLFHDARLVKSSIIPHRTNPSYYRGEPFMPITNNRGVQTSIGFHITILSDDEWKQKGPDYLVRGFDSHGCMRLRQRDLREHYAIVMAQKEPSIRVDVDYYAWNIDQDQRSNTALEQIDQIHPYPFRKDGYKGVRRPLARDPKEHLVVMIDYKGQPDFAKLNNFTADDIKSVAEFNELTAELDAERN